MPADSNPRVRLGLIGYGYWGPNLLRNLVQHGGFDAGAVVDGKESARSLAIRHYPHVKTFASVPEFLETFKPDAVAVATPPETHREVVSQCLRAGADVLVEKPLALTVADCDVLLQESERQKRRLMVDHTFAFHEPIRYLSNQIRAGDLGDLHYFESTRINLGRFQSSTNVLWDLAPHDLSILHALRGDHMPTEVAAFGSCLHDSRFEDSCHVHLRYAGGFTAHLHLSWLSPVKVRTILLGGSKRMIVYDENDPVEKLRIYDSGVDIVGEASSAERRVNYRVGAMTAPAISTREALANVVDAFHKYVTQGTVPALDVKGARTIVKILEDCSRSLCRRRCPHLVR